MVAKYALTTKIVLIANDVSSAERALAAMKAAVDRSAHGFGQSRIARITPESGASNDQFALLCDRVLMEPDLISNTRLPRTGAPEIVPGDPDEPYSFVLRFTERVPSQIGGATQPIVSASRVIVKIVTSASKADGRGRELEKWLNEAVEGGGEVRSGLWVILGQVKPTGDVKDKRLDHSVFLDRDLSALVEQLLPVTSGRGGSVVMSVGNFEYYFLDAYQRVAGRLRRPFDFARDQAVVGDILVGLVRQAPQLRQLVSLCAAWQAHPAQSGGHELIAVLQPMSSNGFFSDDGGPNADRVTGLPLLTPGGMIEDFSGDQWGTRESPFPRSDRELPAWVPYLSADAVLGIVLREAGRLSISCQAVEKELPLRGRLPVEAVS